MSPAKTVDALRVVIKRLDPIPGLGLGLAFCLCMPAPAHPFQGYSYILLSFLAVGCANGSDKGLIDFTVEQEFLPDFEQDTGFLPENQPAQVRVVARAGGTLSMGALADPSEGELLPIDGSGHLSLDAEMSFEVFVNIDTAGIKFNEMVKSFNYAIPASSVDFTPFLLDSSAILDIALPKEELAAIPLGAVPGGSLRLSVEGGDVHLSLSGKCAKSQDELSQFVGALTGNGVVEIGATVVIELAGVGKKEFGPIAIPVNLPDLSFPIDFGTFNADTSKASVAGPCQGSMTGEDPKDPKDPNTFANCNLPSVVDPVDFGAGKGWRSESENYVGLDAPMAVHHEVNLKLYPGYGAFSGGLKPGVYDISNGNDADPKLCGLCLTVEANSDTTPPGSRKQLAARGGTLTLTRADNALGGRLKGKLNSVPLQEYDNNFKSDGCKTTVTEYAFDVSIASEF